MRQKRIYAPKTKDEIIRKLFSKRLIDPETNCWLWTGTKAGEINNQYGVMRIRWHNKSIVKKVHRLAAYIWKNFNLDSDLCACHHCDNQLCINPDHLFIGTVNDNNQDKIQKGRQKIVRGEECGNSKLTEDDVEEIVSLLSQNLTFKEIAKRFNIHRCTIQQIKYGRTWNHITGLNRL